MITSAQNTQVKNVIKLNQKAKARREQGLFIAEGRKMFLEAPDDWIEKVYVAESLLDDEEIMQKAKCFSWDAVENSVFRQMSDTQTPQGVLTVLRQPSYQIEDLLKQESPLLMVLEDLQDPGNAGTIIRTGEGAGIGGVFLLDLLFRQLNDPEICKGRQPLLILGHTLRKIFRVQLADTNQVDILHDSFLFSG